MAETHKQGIDINQALSILSARSQSGPGDRNVENGCPCCHGTPAPDNAHKMGQTLDLEARNETVKEQNTGEEKKLQEERDNRQEEIKQRLNSMSEAELIQAFLNAQEDRVKTYREYETGLTTVLQSGNISSYPGTVLSVTASFSVISDTIRTIQYILENREQTHLSQLIGNLQKYEKDKLNFTASHHLERIRRQNEQQRSYQDSMTNKLLDDGVKSLQKKIDNCIANINEVLDEIRCSLIDLS